MFHQLCDNVDWLLEGADCIELEEIGMVELLHDVGLGDEVVDLHRA